jgi:hypothetical protein
MFAEFHRRRSCAETLDTLRAHAGAATDRTVGREPFIEVEFLAGRDLFSGHGIVIRDQLTVCVARQNPRVRDRTCVS